MELTRSNRNASIDILRGAVMIIMALDHTRDFFHQPALLADPLDAATTTAPIYFTRWITHFCAPVFVLLSGVSAYLASQKRTKNEASLFLIKRGAWLVLAEITLVTFAITFNPTYNFIILQVIWAIGWSMIILGVLSRISYRVVLIAGIILFFGHNILDHVTLPQEGVAGATWSLLFRARPTFIPLNATHVLADIYAILPWTGAMLLGYSIGYWFKKDFPPERRKKFLLSTGAGLTVLFILLRATSYYGNPGPWVKTDGFLHNLFTFLNTSKYPPSLQYLSMTLGPACLLLAVLENAKGKWTRIVSVYGKVPFFFYILHFYLIHIIAVILFYATGHTNSQIVDPNSPIFHFRPLNFGYGLPVVYLIWLGVVSLLYLPCRWYNKYKAEHRQWWLSYI
jgi:uncharacterized membrane protein